MNIIIKLIGHIINEGNNKYSYELRISNVNIISFDMIKTFFCSYGFEEEEFENVTITCDFALLNAGTAAGIATFGGLPFTTLNPTALTYGGNRAGTSSWREDAATGLWYFGYLNPNATSGVLSTSTNGAITWTTSYAYTTSFVYETAS